MQNSPAFPQIILAATLTCALTLSACATQPERRGPPRDGQQGLGAPQSAGTFAKPIGLLFTSMDSNRDTVITQDELMVGIQSEWSEFGRDPSAAQFSPWSITRLGSTDAYPTFMMFDKNFNGVISSEEFKQRLQADFIASDKNADGRLERFEVLIAFEAPRGREKSKAKGREGKGGKGGGDKGGGRPPQR